MPPAAARWRLLGRLEPGGVVEQFAGASSQPLTRIPPPGSSATRIALSPNGDTMYVLRRLSTTANVAVVALRTQSVRAVLPAPAGAVDLAPSLDGRQLYLAASPSGSSNIQTFTLPA